LSENLIGNTAAEVAALAYILRESVRAKELFLLPPYYFQDSLLRKLFEYVLEYNIKNRKIPSLAQISAIASELYDNAMELSKLQTFLLMIHKSEIDIKDKDLIILTLKKEYQARQLSQAQQTASELLSSGKILNACDVLENATKSIHYEEIASESSDNVGTLLKELEEERPPFIYSGLETLDRTTGGFAPGELIILSAPRAAGKSTLMMQLAVNSYVQAKNPVYVNLEMSRREWTCRLFSNITQTDYGKVRGFTLDAKERQLFRFKAALFFAKNKDLFKSYFRDNYKKLHGMNGAEYYDTLVKENLMNDSTITHLGREVCSIPKLSSKLIALKKNNKCDLVMVDYLSWLEYGPQHYKVHEKLGLAAKMIKGIATNLSVPIVVATHVTDEGEVKYSRGVEEHADQVIMWMEQNEQRADPWRFTAETTKARNSALCSLYLEAQFSKMTIREVPRAGAYNPNQ
jgi:replicative DNA helicase